jgi:hypothetical protein
MSARRVCAAGSLSISRGGLHRRENGGSPLDAVLTAPEEQRCGEVIRVADRLDRAGLDRVECHRPIPSESAATASEMYFGIGLSPFSHPAHAGNSPATVSSRLL